MAGKYAYRVTPTAVNWCWNVYVNEVGWSGGSFSAFGSRDRAIRKAMHWISKQEARDERLTRLTVKGP